MVIAIGPDNLASTNAGHVVRKGRKTTTHTATKKMIIREQWDRKKYPKPSDWINHIQGLVDKKRKR